MEKSIKEYEIIGGDVHIFIRTRCGKISAIMLDNKNRYVYPKMFKRYQLEFFANSEGGADKDIRIMFEHLVEDILMIDVDILVEIYQLLKKNDKLMFPYMKEAVKKVKKKTDQVFKRFDWIAFNL